MYEEKDTSEGTIERITCDQTGKVTDEPGHPWVSLGSLGSPGKQQRITITSELNSRPLHVKIPRELNFANYCHARDWLATAIENHIERCEQEDAANEHRPEHAEALEMDKELHDLLASDIMGLDADKLLRDIAAEEKAIRHTEEA